MRIILSFCIIVISRHLYSHHSSRSSEHFIPKKWTHRRILSTTDTSIALAVCFSSLSLFIQPRQFFLHLHGPSPL